MRIVVKVGTSTLAYPTGMINIRHIEKLSKALSDIKNMGNEVVLVSSGAVGMGVGKLCLKKRPTDMPTIQAAAAVGQCELMYSYDKLFSEYNHNVAQILVTAPDLDDSNRSDNIKNTIDRLLQLNVLPIINENDTISTDEIKVGDNDTLAALISVKIEADLLIILSDIDGLYTADPKKDPNAKLIPIIEDVDEKIISMAGSAGSEFGTGGMATKIIAADICTKAGCDMIIANGEEPYIIYDIIDDDFVGTKFLHK